VINATKKIFKKSGGKMNVILIISDTFRRDNLTCYGGKEVHTPHIDRFSEKCFVFDRAYCASFPTVPNRNDVLTGRYTFTYKEWSPIGNDEITLPSVLNEAGIVTQLIVDTPHPFKPLYNYQKDFQGWELIRGQEHDEWKTSPRDVKLPCSPEKLRNPETTVKQYLRNVSGRKKEADFFVAQTMQTASDWLEENHKHPFFLYVDTFDPHEPWDPPEYYVNLYDPGYKGEEIIYPRYDKCDFLTEEELNHCRALYRGEVTLVDRWVGNLLERVESLGLTSDTMIIFTTDHGFYIGEHGYIGKSLLTPQYQQSITLYPEVSSIPLLIYMPESDKPGTLKAFAQPVDLMPTILDFMGTETPQTVEGKSLIPILKGKQENIRQFVIASPAISSPNIEIPHPTIRSSIIDDKKWMLIYGSQIDKVSNKPEVTRNVDSILRKFKTLEKGPIKPELYHLPTDPHCTKNVIQENIGKAKQLHSLYFEFLKEQKVPEKHLQFFKHI